jgi:class 3 adenylate cyclase
MQARLRELQGPGGSRVAFGIGINTGEGIVGNIGTAELMNYTIIGDVVNVAARLQGEARAGEVLLSEAAYRHIAGRVEAEELGSMHVKGRVQPVQIYKVIRLAQP